MALQFLVKDLDPLLQGSVLLIQPSSLCLIRVLAELLLKLAYRLMIHLLVYSFKL